MSLQWSLTVEKHCFSANTATVGMVISVGWSTYTMSRQLLDWLPWFFFIFIHGAQGMNPFVFCDPLTYHLVLPSCQIFHLSSEIFQHQQYGLAQNLTFMVSSWTSHHHEVGINILESNVSTTTIGQIAIGNHVTIVMDWIVQYFLLWPYTCKTNYIPVSCTLWY